MASRPIKGDVCASRKKSVKIRS